MSQGPIKYSDFYDADVQQGLENLRRLFQEIQRSASAMRTAFTSEAARAAKQVIRLSEDLEAMKKKFQQVDPAARTAADVVKNLVNETNNLIANHTEAKQKVTDLSLIIGVHTMGLKECRDTIKSLEKEYSELSADTEENRKRQDALLKKIGEVSKQFNTLSTNLRTAKRNVDLVAGSYAHLSSETNRMKKELQNMPNAFDKITGAINKNNKEAVELQKNIERNINLLKKMDAQMGMHYRNVGNYSSAFSKFGGSLAGFIGQTLGIASAADALRKILRANIELEGQIADFRRVAGLSRERAGEIVDDLKNILTPTSTAELVRIATIGAQMDVATDQIVGYTDAVDKLAVVLKNEMPGGAEVVAESLGKINGVFGVSEQLGISVGEALEKTGSTILALGQAGLATGSYLQDFTLRVGGVAKSANMALPDVLAYGAVLEEAGITAEVAGTAFNRLVGSLASRRQQFYAIAKIADAKLTLQDFTDLINTDTNAALTLFYKGLNQGGTSLTSFNDLLDTIKIKAGPGKNAIIALAREQEKLTERIQQGTEAFNEGTLAGDQFTEMNTSLAASWDLMIKAFTDVSTKRSIADVFQGLIDGVTNVTTSFNKLISSDSWKEFWLRLGSTISLDPSRRKLLSMEADLVAQSEHKQKLGPLGAEIDEFSKLSIQEQQRVLKIQEDIVKRLTAPGAGAKNSDINWQIDRLSKMREVLKKPTGSKENSPEVVLEDEKALKKALEAAKKARQESLSMITDYEQLELLALQNSYAKKEITEQQHEEKKLLIRKKALEDRIKILEQSPEADDQRQAKMLQEQLKTLDIDFTKWKLRSEEKLLQQRHDLELANLDLIYAQGQIREEEYQKRRTELLAAELDRRAELEEDAAKKAQLIAQAAMLRKEGNDKSREKVFNQTDREIFRNLDITQAGLDSRELRGEDVRADRLRLEGEMLQERLKLYKEHGKDVTDLEYEIAMNVVASDNLKLEKQIENIEKASDIMMSVTDVVRDYMGDGWGDMFETLTDQLLDFVKRGKIGFKDLAEAVQFFGTLAAGAGRAILDGQIEASQNRISLLENEKARAIQIETAGVDDKERAEAAKARIEDEYAKRVAAEKRKQAIATRNNALFEIAINTLIGASKVIGQTGLFGLPLVPVILGLGAAQAAAVLAKPIPEYWTGTSSSEEGPAHVAERGPELLESPRTKKRTLVERPSLVYLEEGTRVYNARQTEDILRDMPIGSNVLSNVIQQDQIRKQYQLDRQAMQIVENYATSKAITVMSGALRANKIDEERIGAVVGRYIQEMPVTHWSVDEKGFRRRIRKGNTITELINKRNRL